jgi:hypothetical protein
VSALQNISRARFRRAANAMATTIADLSERRAATSSPVAGRKAAAVESEAETVAA